MKRMLQFKKTDAGYACFENDENVFEIAKSNLQFDVRAFYQAFYSEDKDFEDCTGGLMQIRRHWRVFCVLTQYKQGVIGALFAC